MISEELLARFVALQPKAQRIYERTMQEEFRGWKPEGECWPTLEYGYDGDLRWHCGFRVRSDESTEWVLRAVSRAPGEAVQAMIEDLT